MTTRYLDFTSGLDANNGLSWDKPKLTFAAINTAASAGDTVIIAKTADSAIVSNGTNFTWTVGSPNVTTGSSQMGIISPGDVIGRLGARGNGVNTNGTDSSGQACTEPYYTVASVDAAKVVLISAYAGAGNVASVTESGCRRVVPVSTAGITCTKALTVSGGWTLAASPTQDGETWIYNATATAVVITIIAGCVVSKVNIGGYNGGNGAHAFSGAGSVFDCSVTKGQGAFASSFNGTSVITRCVASLYTNGYGFTMTTNSQAVDSDFFCPSTKEGIIGSVNSTITNCKFYGMTIGINNASAGMVATSCYADRCTTGFTASTGKMISCLTKLCTTGFSLSGSSYAESCTADGATTQGFGIFASGYIKGCFTTGCAIGVAQYSSAGNITENLVIDHTSTSDTTGFFFGASVLGVSIVNATITTPINYAFSRNLTGGIYRITGGTVDKTSFDAGRCFQIVTGASYAMPQYYVQNFRVMNGASISSVINGRYWANASLLEDYSTTPHSLACIWNGTSGLQNAPFDILAVMGKSGVARTISVNYWL
ncbi:MAG: hypothetical protein WCO30_01705, partial [bacterium]